MDSDSLYHMLGPGKQLSLGDPESKRLFHPTQTAVESLSICLDQHSFKATDLVSERDLEICLSCVEKSRIRFFLLRQHDSWSRIQISYQGFATLVRQLNVFHPFWTCVEGFGLKFEPRDEYHLDYKSRFHVSKSSEHIIERLEMCYTVRYFEKHNRPNTNAIWSERQTAIYQSFEITDRISVWVLIQSSKSMRSGIRKFLAKAEQQDLTPADHLKPHLFFFLQLADNWRAYINFLESQLSDIDEKALHSKVPPQQKFDYSVTFRDIQTLEIIRRKLLKALLILKSNADVGKSWAQDVTRLAQHIVQLDEDDILEVMPQYIASLERHSRVVNYLLDRLSGTSKLLFQLLGCRNDDLKIKTSLDIKRNGQQLRALTENSITTNDAMTALTGDIHSDSKFIKTLTFITVFYTPASLIATIFSSNLVQIAEATGDRTHLVLNGDFWKFPVFTICLLVVTLMFAFGWRSFLQKTSYLGTLA